MINNKKAAMFGLCRILRKQSGRLFLVSSQRVDSQETRVEHQFKRAAMFGLDARIALSIFGALSVISGAALYSAIQSAKVTAVIVEMNEFGKAWEQHYLDTGNILNRRNDASAAVVDYYLLDSAGLITNTGKSGWNGPYIASQNLSAANFKNIRGEDVWFGQFSTEDWSSYVNAACTTGLKCGIWLRYWKLGGIMSTQIIQSIDERLDNADGADKGIFRWDSTSINYKYLSIENPND